MQVIIARITFVCDINDYVIIRIKQTQDVFDGAFALPKAMCEYPTSIGFANTQIK